ncbi:hypothetical protein [uncultured Lamprocystis sp.]|jgi:hypothetical protein|uniref:hypothetical protein n=1 Tax=uncultured Lamprocystis sp. TaxID=543132 RepID=UPI0025FDCB05|nr:hypothetical protein [uncultured Lamprocystis sp.]
MLSGWSDFFAMTGSAGATLVGLLFVVVTLGTGLPTSRTMDIARASMTPALYSFSGVLLQSMVALVPWQSSWPSGAIFVVMGIGGVIYRIRAIRFRSTLHLGAISGPIDWIFHNVVPLVASVSLITGGAGLIAGAAFGPFAIAGASVLLLVSGIYRTWGETLALIGMKEKL